MSNLFNPQFEEVQRAQCKASIAIEGLSGKGKSGLALMLAWVLAGEKWEDVAALDTENRSLNLFRGLSTHLGGVFGPFKKFDLTKVHGYRPSHYIKAKEVAINAGAKAFVQDSITHAWIGPSGVLDLVSKAEAANKSVNKFNAWGTPDVSNEKNSIFEMIRDSEIHMITTVRLKEKFLMETGKGITSLGEQMIMMPDLKYEPDLVLQMQEAGSVSGQAPIAKVLKSRYAIFEKDEVYEFDLELMRQLKSYLEEGADPAVIQEAQRKEILGEIKYVLDNSTSKRTVWNILKEQAGHADTPLDDMPLKVARQLLSQLLV